LPINLSNNTAITSVTAQNPAVVDRNRLASSKDLNRPLSTNNSTSGSSVNSDQVNDQVNSGTTASNRVFKLSPSQSEQVSSLRSANSRVATSSNSSVSQYLQTAEISKKEELESLVGLDVFV